jgi:hypothetical protein
MSGPGSEADITDREIDIFQVPEPEVEAMARQSAFTWRAFSRKPAKL